MARSHQVAPLVAAAAVVVAADSTAAVTWVRVLSAKESGESWVALDSLPLHLLPLNWERQSPA